MKQSSKSSAIMGGNGDFDEEPQSGHHNHNHTYNNCNIHHHHYHFHNEASGDEEQNPSVKQADPVKVTPSSSNEKKKPTETILPTQALPMNDSPPTEKPYVLIQSAADPNYFLSVRDGKVIIALFSLGDESQHWYQNVVINPPYKLREWSATICSCCCIVNKATGEAIKDPDEADSPADLITYDDSLVPDGSIIWETSKQSCGVSVTHTSIIPFDHADFILEANLTSRGTSDDGAIVYVNRYKKSKDNPYKWIIIHYKNPVKLVTLDTK